MGDMMDWLNKLLIFYFPVRFERVKRVEKYEFKNFSIRPLASLEANGLRANYHKLVLVVVCSYSLLNAESINLSVGNAAQTQKVAIACAMVGTDTHESRQMSELLKKALEFTQQCSVQVFFIPELLSKQEALSYKAKQFNYLLFIDCADSHHIAWHLFDIEGGTMQKSKRVAKRGPVLRGWAYAVADSIYETMMNEPGFFSTKIAYTKRVPLKKGTHHDHIYIADYDGSNQECIINTPTVNVAPRWNKDVGRPLLFYSENTTVNMRMMVTDMHKKKIVACNYDGLTMLPAFSDDGKAVMYCATRGSGSCQLYYWCNKSLKKITNNEGNNFSPSFGPQGKIIYFSSDFETGKPQIYALNLETQVIERITQDGYCICPHYCPAKKQLAYVKAVQGVMQLFSYDVATREHQQLTHDTAQKEECMWSACGNFILCAKSQGNSSSIVLFDTRSQEYRYLTGKNDFCAYPAWSGIYNEYPIIA